MAFIRSFSMGLLLMIAFGIGVDQGSKLWSEENLLLRSDPSDSTIYQGSRRVVASWGQPLSGIESIKSSHGMVLQWNYVRNHGAAYGTFSNLSDSVRLPLFHVLTGLFCAFFLGIALTNKVKVSLGGRLALGLMITGALGNLIDRLIRGYVIDLIDFRALVFGYRVSLPVFNVADVFVMTGLFLLIVSTLRR